MELELLGLESSHFLIDEIYYVHLGGFTVQRNAHHFEVLLSDRVVNELRLTQSS